MITHRSCKKVKIGCLDEFKALVLVEVRAANPKHGFRIYTSRIGIQTDLLAMEIDFDDLGVYEQFWQTWESGKTAPMFAEHYVRLVESDFSNEIWNRSD